MSLLNGQYTTNNSPEALLELDSSRQESASNKRRRVSVACQRCKSRKQKCDGSTPTCSSCSRSSSECIYEVSNIPKATERKLYVKALEERVAELESGLSYDGKVGFADDHWERLQPREEATPDSLSGAIRELSLSASGFYVGGTAHITLGRLLGSAFPGPQALHVTETAAKANANALKTSYPGSGNGNCITVPLFSKPNVEVLFRAYLKYVAPEYPIIHSRRLRDMHARRNKLNDTWEVAVLHFVYAIAGCSLKLTGETGDYSLDEHHECAMSYKDSIVHFLDRRSVIYLSLAAIYSLRTPTKPGPWVLILFAVELCIMLGLHRKDGGSGFGLGSELDKRLFWSVYSLDRHSSISTGRPPAISDHDIDVPLPLDINEDTVVLEDFRKALAQDREMPASPPTTLTDFIHNVRIRRIQSNIQHEIYRVDQKANPSHDIIDGFLLQLSRWRKSAPLKGANINDQYNIQYYLAVRLLLFPQISENPVNAHYFQLCADACIEVCEGYRRLYLNSIGLCLPPAVTQWIFLSGLTLIYCMWHSPQDMAIPRATSAIHSCSSMLYVMAERWSPAQQYRNAFERVKDNIIQYVSSKNDIPSDSFPSSTFNAETQDALKEVFAAPGMESLGLAFNNIIAADDYALNQTSHFATEGENQLWFDLDNLGSIAPGEEQLGYEEVRDQQSSGFHLDEGVEYNWDILDAVFNSRQNAG